MSQIPTIGRIVRYRLSVTDAEQINRRRTTGTSIALRIVDGKWPIGAQAHIGRPVEEGEVYPMMVTKTWGNAADSKVNGQVFLDGNDLLWATSVAVGDGPGTFFWPARA